MKKSIEDYSHPVIAERVWAGTKWNYPNIELLCAKLALAQAEYKAWRAVKEAASALINDSGPRETLNDAAAELRRAIAENDRINKENT